jgi:Fe2+ transport system protein FeoA
MEEILLEKQKLDGLKRSNTHPLASMRPGSKCRFVGIKKGFSHGHRRRHRHRWSRESFEQGKKRGFGIFSRLLDLGLTKGCTFEVVQASTKGPVLIEIRGTRIALGHGLASRIIVEEVSSG